MKIYKKQGSQIGLFFCLLVFCITCSCEKEPDPVSEKVADFETVPQQYPIQPGIIDEASGLVPSKHLAGYLWTHQDSGAPASVYLLSTDGKRIREYKIPGARNHDWEDLAIGPGPVTGTTYLYLGDTGNNNAVTPANAIYRVPEITDSTASFGNAEKITYKYPDGPRDAEALLLDPATRDLYIISKETSTTGIYRLAYPQSTSETITAEKVGTIPGLSIVTAGDLSPDGSEILIRTYLAVYYWKRKADEPIGQALMRSSDKQMLINLEPQGESVCFDMEAKGFYTLSERGKAPSVSLNYYKRK